MTSVDETLSLAGGIGIGIALGFLLGVSTGYGIRHAEEYINGFSDGTEVTDREWFRYMKTHCICWFDDSRCKVSHPIVVCKMPRGLSWNP